MLIVSPNMVANYRKCPANAGYTYVGEDPVIATHVPQERRESGGPALRRGRNRGRAIHAATWGTGPEIDERDKRLHLNVVDAYHPTVAAVDSQIIWAVLDKLWPGAEWHKETTLTTMLTPHIQLLGRLDGWALWEDCLLEVDLKTSTAFHTTELDGRENRFDVQSILYGRLLRDHVGRLPQVWRIGFNPNTKRPHRRQYPLSDELIEQASRYAIHVACAVERMHTEDSLTWHRTFACDVPFPCNNQVPCARDMGSWYTDGKPTPATTDDSNTTLPPRTFENPISPASPFASLPGANLQRTKK